VAALLATGLVAVPATAAPPPAVDPPDTAPSDEVPDTAAGALQAANRAWRSGEWSRVQGLLADYVERDDAFENPADLQEARVLMADALLQDPELPPETAREEAVGLLSLVVESNPEWEPPTAIYSPALYEAVGEARARREAVQADNCKVERAVCVADLSEKKSDNTQLKLDYDELKLRYDAQEVEVVDKAVRSRALALIPFGTGHFLNNNPRLGITFVTAELAFGATALGLLLTRNIKYGCDRPNGGIGGDTLVCRPPNGKNRFTEADKRELANVRTAETTFGWLFLGSVLADIVVAQVLFEPELTLRRRRIPRSELEKEEAGEDVDGANPRRRDRRGARLKWRPTGGATRDGASFGVRLDF